MKIGIDARLLLYRRGMGNYVYNLVKNLVRIDPENEYILYLDKGTLEDQIFSRDNIAEKVIAFPSYILWEQIRLPIAAKGDKLDILHCPANTEPLLLSRRTKLIVTIHDIMFLLPYKVIPRSPSLYQRLGRLYRSKVVSAAAKKASLIITDSAHSKRGIIRSLNIPEEKIAVIYLAPGEGYRTLEDEKVLGSIKKKYGINTRFILNLGGIDPRKNTARLIGAFYRLKRSKLIEHKLVVVGVNNWKYSGFWKLVSQFGLEDEIILADFIPEEDLLLLYNAAELFVYPSLYEGFGLPVLEAMACGTPVVASNISSIPEIIGDAGVLIDPQNEVEIGEAILRVLKNENLRKELIEKGLKQGKKFSGEKMAEETLKVYEAVYRGVVE